MVTSWKVAGPNRVARTGWSWPMPGGFIVALEPLILGTP